MKYLRSIIANVVSLIAGVSILVCLSSSLITGREVGIHANLYFTFLNEWSRLINNYYTELIVELRIIVIPMFTCFLC